jgi:DNA-directed RNA polymerase specialized sigma subunit
VITSDDNEPQSVDHVDQALVDQTPVGDTITTQEEETINERIEELQRELAELPPEGEDEDEDEDESVACEREALQGELDDLNNQLANSEVVNTAPVVELPDEENEVASDSVQNPPSVEASAPVAEVLLPVPEVKPVNPRCKAAPLATPTTKTDGLTQTQLAARLNVSQGTVSRQSKSGAYAFSQWSQTQDPEGVAWQLQGKLYFRKGAK